MGRPSRRCNARRCNVQAETSWRAGQARRRRASPEAQALQRVLGEGQSEGQTALTPQAGVEGENGLGMVGANAQAQVGTKPCSERLANPAISRIQAGHRQLVSPGS